MKCETCKYFKDFNQDLFVCKYTGLNHSKYCNKYEREDIKKLVSALKNQIHNLSVENVNSLTKKQFDILREVESKLNEFGDDIK